MALLCSSPAFRGSASQVLAFFIEVASSQICPQASGEQRNLFRLLSRAQNRFCVPGAKSFLKRVGARERASGVPGKAGGSRFRAAKIRHAGRTAKENAAENAFEALRGVSGRPFGRLPVASGMPSAPFFASFAGLLGLSLPFDGFPVALPPPFLRPSSALVATCVRVSCLAVHKPPR